MHSCMCPDQPLLKCHKCLASMSTSTTPATYACCMPAQCGTYNGWIKTTTFQVGCSLPAWRPDWQAALTPLSSTRPTMVNKPHAARGRLPASTTASASSQLQLPQAAFPQRDICSCCHAHTNLHHLVMKIAEQALQQHLLPYPAMPCCPHCHRRRLHLLQLHFRLHPAATSAPASRHAERLPILMTTAAAGMHALVLCHYCHHTQRPLSAPLTKQQPGSCLPCCLHIPPCALLFTGHLKLL